MKKEEKEWKPFRHNYANCLSNVLINEFMRYGIPYYPIFAYGFEFVYAPRPDRLLGESIADRRDNYNGYWDIIYRTYGIECYFEDVDPDKDAFVEKMRTRLTNAPVPCLIDGYYDPATEYAHIYQKEHGSGHGRYVTKIDSDTVYYYATHINDPEGCFAMCLDDFHLACEKFICFKYPEKIKEKEERHRILQEVLYDWFINRDHNRMIEKIKSFSEDVRNMKTLGDEIDHQFEAHKVPASEMFKRLHKLYHSRGATLDFVKGYAEEFENKAYEDPIRNLQKSVELWEKARFLLVKYGMAPAHSTQEAMADCLLEISREEQQAVTKIRSIICEEMNTEPPKE